MARKGTAAVAGAVAAALALPAGAGAQTGPVVSVKPDSGKVVVDATGHPGADAISVDVGSGGRTVVVTIPGRRFATSGTCVPGLGSVTCVARNADGFFSAVHVSSGAGDDVIRLQPGGAAIERWFDFAVIAGDGRDTVTGTDAGGYLVSDFLAGGPGDDRLTGGAGESRLDGAGGADVLDGGAGYDLLLGGDAGDALLGGGGADQLEGGAGADALDGGAEADRLEGGPGADDIRGGLPAPGWGEDDLDVVDYGEAATAIDVTLDGVAGDGVAGEGDNVHPDVETVDANRPCGPCPGHVNVPGTDRIVGNDGENRIHTSNDAVIHGGGGYDQLGAGVPGGTVEIHGGDGIDIVGATAAQALLVGGDGNDRLTARGGAAELLGGPGDDQLYADDGAGDDVLGCGDGFDFFAADPGDVLNDCEAVR